MADHPIETLIATDAYARAKTLKLRRYPSPERDGDRLYPLAAPAPKPSFRFKKSDKVFTIGSCFARNVESALVDVGITVTSNESNLGPVGESLGQATNFFNKYSIHSILNDLRWALEPETYPGDAVIYALPKQGHYADLQLGMAKLAFPLDDIRAFRQRYLEVMARAIDADVIIITLGYVETWYDRELGLYLNTSPPQPLVKAAPDRFEFRVLSFEDVLGALREVHALLTKHRQKPLKMLLTVSPVPLLSTFRDMDVLVANTYSKAVQRAAIEQFVGEVDGVDYFPSYETVILSNPAVAWSRGDYRHVSADLVAQIMANVIAHYVETDTPEGAPTDAALLASVRMLLKMEDFAEVKGLADKHRSQFNQNPDLLIFLGIAQLKLREVEAAFATFEAAHNLAPKMAAPLERLITLCRPMRQPERAKALLADHARLFPEREKFRKNVTR